MLVSLIVALAVESVEAATLTLRTGKLLGRRIEGGRVAAYLGVPFAAPPVGALRWQPPQSPSNWSGTREALVYSKSCVQHKNAFVDLSAVSEDCLYLNVWLPTATPPPGGYPVMLFFYGGSWELGSAMFPLYGGKHLASLGVIAVAANYRLNEFGFLGADALRGSDNATGNFGIADQRFAMSWVHDNAAALGADPKRLMIFGESAGAGSVANHL